MRSHPCSPDPEELYQDDQTIIAEQRSRAPEPPSPPPANASASFRSAFPFDPVASPNARTFLCPSSGFQMNLILLSRFHGGRAIPDLDLTLKFLRMLFLPLIFGVHVAQRNLTSDCYSNIAENDPALTIRQIHLAS